MSDKLLAQMNDLSAELGASRVRERDLLRENAELRASHVRMRDLIRSSIECTNSRKYVAETSEIIAEALGTSLAAITAPLEARIAELRTALKHIEELNLNHPDPKWVIEFIAGYARQTLAQTPEQSLAAIQAAARAEEREACLEIAMRYTKSHVCANFIGMEIRNRATEAQP